MNEFSRRLRSVCASRAAQVAVMDRGHAFTYAELERAVAQVAAALDAAGLGPGSLVALDGVRGMPRVVDLAAIFRVGAAALLLCPRWPMAFRQQCLTRSGARAVLREGVPRAVAGAHRPLVACRELAYVVYTSGSAGEAKGVMVPHAGLVPVLDAQRSAFGIHTQSRCLFLLGLGFDASLSDIGTALLSGATLVMEDELACAPGRLLETVARCGVTYADVPPAFLPYLPERALPNSLETLVVGGEVPPAADVARLAGEVALFNVYGPSEATICTSFVRCDERWERPLIGLPIAGNLYTLRDGGTATSAGREGELIISGPGVAYGYLGADAESARRFFLLGGQRAFRTGDRVLQRPDGQWEFLGRVDRQLKRHGQLVAPEQVEAALLRTGLVRAASVALRRDPSAAVARARDSGQLVARVELRAPADPDAMSYRLLQRLAAELPPALVPDRVEVASSLARTPSGKLQHAPLGPPSATRATAAPYAPTRPDSGSLSILGALMGQVLGCPPLGPDDDFYEHGGDSLRALEVVARAEAGGWALPTESLPHGRSPRGVLGFAGAAKGALADASLTAGTAPASTRTTASWASALGSWRQALTAGAPPTVSRAPEGAPASLLGARVLVTGATGTLGRALLPLLRAELGPSGRVYALVRRPEASREIETDGLRAPVTLAPVRPWVGDLRDPLLGLGVERYAALRDSVDAVLHLGASVGAAATEQELTDTNARGTLHVLRFAGAGRQKALLYVSTLSVLCDALPRPSRCLEADSLGGLEALATPYAASKWLAERLVREAEAVPRATVVRLGLLTGEVETGHGAERGHLARFIRGVAALGALPVARDSDLAATLAFDVTPLDRAARACLGLFAHDRARAVGGTYHVAAPRPATLMELHAALRAEGVELDARPWPELCARAGRSSELCGDAALALLSLCRFDAAAFARHRALDLFAATGTHFSLVNTRRALAADLQRLPPEPDLALLRRYVRSALA